MIKIGKFIDLSGKNFGCLTVIRKIQNNSKKLKWLCKCNCGKYVEKTSYSLTHNSYPSCGCVNIQHKKYNTYDLSGNYGIGYTSKGEPFYFDLEDYDKIKDYHWYKNSHGYITSYIPNSFNQNQIRLHRLVMNVSDSKTMIDHIYHKKYDNRKSQLRIVNNEQNAYNSKIYTNNSSGYKGVYWHKKHNCWMSSIQYHGKQIYLGLYSNIDDAIQARQNAEDKYFNEYKYRCDNIDYKNNDKVENNKESIII